MGPGNDDWSWAINKLLISPRFRLVWAVKPSLQPTSKPNNMLFGKELFPNRLVQAVTQPLLSVVWKSGSATLKLWIYVTYFSRLRPKSSCNQREWNSALLEVMEGLKAVYLPIKFSDLPLVKWLLAQHYEWLANKNLNLRNSQLSSWNCIHPFAICQG